MKVRAEGDRPDPERKEPDTHLRLLPAVYVEMPEEKEEQAVAAVAALLDVIVDRDSGMALTSTHTRRSGLDQTSPRPGQGGDDGIEEDPDPGRPGSAGCGLHPSRALPPDLY